MKAEQLEPRKLHVQLQFQLQERVTSLPVLPIILSQMLMLNPDDPQYFDVLLRLAEVDPNASMQLLVAANSAASSPRTPVVTVRMAISRLGSQNARYLLLAISVMRAFAPRTAMEKSLWIHALQVAIASRKLAEHTNGKIKADEAYTCGLLHDVGRFLIFKEAPDLLGGIDEGSLEHPDELEELERSICGMTHSELGRIACTKWELPESIINIVGNHHAPDSADGKPPAPLAVLIRLADLAMFPSALPGAPGLADDDAETLDAVLRPKLPAFCKLTKSKLKMLIGTSISESAAISKAIGLA